MSTRAASVKDDRKGFTGLHLLSREDRAKKRKGTRRLVTIGATVLLVVTILVAILLEQVILAQSAFELSSLRESLTAEEARHEELLMEAAKRDNAARIERFARQSLGMMDPAPGHIHYVVADVRTGDALAEGAVAGRPIALKRAGVTHLGSVTASGGNYGGLSP
ncbi:MAG TPA: hypothetical protein VNP73_07865 [Actinomycetota bacterium]|nr:hypothetical protein [Actinomycetota bacterium]